MALMKCDCGQEISDQAQKCPHCGKEITVVKTEQRPAKRTKATWFIVAGIVAVGIITLWLILPSSVKQAIGVVEESGLYRLQEITVHVDADDFTGNDDTGGSAAPEIYAVVYHNQDKILSTYDKAPQDKWDAVFYPTSTIGWAKGDTLTVKIYDKDLMDDDGLFIITHGRLYSGELTETSEKGSQVKLTLTKIK